MMQVLYSQGVPYSHITSLTVSVWDELVLQILNPSETFGDIIVDYSYVECTSACITALSAFRKAHPDHRTKEIAKSLARGKL